MSQKPKKCRTHLCRPHLCPSERLGQRCPTKLVGQSHTHKSRSVNDFTKATCSTSRRACRTTRAPCRGSPPCTSPWAFRRTQNGDGTNGNGTFFVFGSSGPYLLNKSFFEWALRLRKSESAVPICAVPICVLPRSSRQVAAQDRKSTRLNSSHSQQSRMPSSA